MRLILTEKNLGLGSQGKRIDQITGGDIIYNTAISFEIMKANVVIFVDRHGNKKYLKNRYGMTGNMPNRFKVR
jgi:hypothetical protein